MAPSKHDGAKYEFAKGVPRAGETVRLIGQTDRQTHGSIAYLQERVISGPVSMTGGVYGLPDTTSKITLKTEKVAGSC